MVPTRGPIGLDIGHRCIKAAQLSHLAGKARLEAAMTLERREEGAPLSDAEAQRLAEVLRRRGFTGRRVVTAVPGEALLANVLTLPPAGSGAPLEQIARAEMARAHRCETDAMEVAFWPLPAPARANEGAQSLAVACEHESAETLLDAMAGAGLDVVALDVDGCALARACRSLLDEAQGIVAAVDLGWHGARLVLLHGGTVIYERMLGGVGLASVAQIIERDGRLEADLVRHLLCRVGLSTPPDDSPYTRLSGMLRNALEAHFTAVTQEVRLSLAYAANQYRGTKVGQRLLLVGGGAEVPGLAEHLGDALDAEVRAVRPSELVSCAAALAEEAASSMLAVALGLAQYPRKEMA